MPTLKFLEGLRSKVQDHANKAQKLTKAAQYVRSMDRSTVLDLLTLDPRRHDRDYYELKPALERALEEALPRILELVAHRKLHDALHHQQEADAARRVLLVHVDPEPEAPDAQPAS